MTGSNTTDWKQVAETLREIAKDYENGDEHDANWDKHAPVYDAAIRLCELAAKLPAGEAERVLEAAHADPRRSPLGGPSHDHEMTLREKYSARIDEIIARAMRREQAATPYQSIKKSVRIPSGVVEDLAVEIAEAHMRGEGLCE